MTGALLSAPGDDDAKRAAAEQHYGEPVTRLQRGSLVLWAPTRIVEEARAARAFRQP